MGEEPLDEILRISRWMTAVAEKTVERRPISFAKSGERLSSGFLRLRVASTQYHGPMHRLKRSTALLQRSRDRFRLRSVAYRTRSCENKIARAGVVVRDADDFSRRCWCIPAAAISVTEFPAAAPA